MLNLSATLAEQARQALLVFYLMLAPPVQAEPVGARMLDEIQVRTAPHHALIEVHFTFPMQVLSHFPLHQGRELRIRLNPALVPDTDRAAIPTREARRPANAEAASLVEVAWEGEMTGGPFLVLEFDREVEFEVLSDANARSLYVVVMELPPCESESHTPTRTEP